MRQYIGARYVIKIYKNSQDSSSMEWENTEYEPFTIVSYLNNSYISRDQVPVNAGNPTVATSHWALFGYASGQIAHLQDQIDAEILARIAADEKITERYALYIGNSFTDGDGSSTGTSGIYALTKDMFDDAWKFTAGARGLVNYGDFTTNFLTLLQDAITSTSFDNDKITDVILIGAYGDERAYDQGVSESDFQTNANAIKAAALSAFPNLRKISYANAHANYDFNARGYFGKFVTPFKCEQMLERVITKAGITYLSWIGWPLMLDTSMFSSDMIHPNDAGYNILAGRFRTAYTGGNINFDAKKFNTALTVNGHATESLYALKPDRVHLNAGRIDRRISGVDTPFVINSNDALTFKMSNNLFFPPMSRAGELIVEFVNGTNKVDLTMSTAADSLGAGFIDLIGTAYVPGGGTVTTSGDSSLLSFNFDMYF